MNIWRERINRWLRPLAARSPLSPNAISCVAVVLNLAAAALLSQAHHRPNLFLWSILLLGLGGFLDAFDGAVARAQGKESRWGDFLDHVFDRLSDFALFAGWILGTGVRPLIGISSLLAIMMNGYLGTQIEASFGKRSYEGTGRGEFVIAMVIFPLIAWSVRGVRNEGLIFAQLSLFEWLTLLVATVATWGFGQRLRLAWRLSRNAG